ncbi:MAG: acetylglutamate kinase [Pseudomonadota bacterium]
MVETRNVIIELLSQLGSSREAREYLRRFSSVEKTEFAVIKVGGGVLAEELDQLAWALTFLHRVGLYPIVLHGAGPQLNRALEDAGVESRIDGGLRVTTPEVMAVARPVIYEQNLRLVDELEDRGVRARGLLHGVFEAEPLDPDRYGLVGHVSRVHTTALRSAVRAAALPIVACMGETTGGQVLNINADFAAGALVRNVKPYKVVFLTPTGGLLDEEERIISAINLKTDYEQLLATDWVTGGMRLKLEQIHDLLQDLPSSSSVSITSAEHLTKELFTHTGSGTLVRRGERFEHHERVDAGQRERLTGLLEMCFERKLGAGYWDQVAPDRIILAESGRAAAIVELGVDGRPYLDKFAVTPEAQGEGLGSALWNQLTQRYDQLYWRSRFENPINGWYARQADATFRRGRWRVFAYGIEDIGLLGDIARDAGDRAESWESEL